MSATKVEITYLGKEPRVDPVFERVIEYKAKYAIGRGNNWKKHYIEKFRKILDKFEGIKEIRFYV